MADRSTGARRAPRNPGFTPLKGRDGWLSGLVGMAEMGVGWMTGLGLRKNIRFYQGPGLAPGEKHHHFSSSAAATRHAVS